MPRVITRAIMVDFSLPAIGPQSDHEDEEELFSSGCVSKAIGWAIKTGKELEGKREEITYFSQMLKGVFSGRNCKNWAMLLDKVTLLLIPCFGFICMSRISSFSWKLDRTSMVDGVVQQAKGWSVGVKQSKQMDALSILMQTADDMLEAVRGKSVIEVYINNRWMS